MTLKKRGRPMLGPQLSRSTVFLKANRSAWYEQEYKSGLRIRYQIELLNTEPPD
jgi:hypothetical protein